MNDRFDNDDVLLKKTLKKIEVKVPNVNFTVLNQLKMRKTKRRPMRVATIAIVAVLLISGTVFAMNYSSFKALIDGQNPAFSEHLQPVEISCTNENIKMEVVAVASYDKLLKAYINMTDLRGNRIEEGRVYDINIQNAMGFSSVSTTPVYLDENTGEGTICLTVRSDDVFEGKDIIFSIDKIYFNEKKAEGYDTEINWSKLSDMAERINVTDMAFFNMVRDWELIKNAVTQGNSVYVLKPSMDEIEIPDMNGVAISNVAFVDGMLHVLIKEQEESELKCSLVDANGNRIGGEPLYEYFADTCEELPDTFGKDASEWPDGTDKLTELVFDVGPQDINRYRLIADAKASESCDGNWQVKVQAAQMKQNKTTISCQLNLLGYEIKSIELTPFGIATEGHAQSDMQEMPDTLKKDMDVYVEAGDTKIPLTHTYSTGPEALRENKIITVWEAERPLELEKVTAIILDGVRVENKN